MPKPLIPIRISGGMNNRYTPLALAGRDKGECVRLINTDLSIVGKITPLWRLAAISTAVHYPIHSLFRANSLLIAGYDKVLAYLSSGALHSLYSAFSGERLSFGHAGNWVFMSDGTTAKALYLSGPTLCDWGQTIPAAGPTCVSGAAGNPDGTYSCYYRYRITLPDGTIVLTALSTLATSIAVVSQKIEWSDIVHASFPGATSVQVDLFRTKTGFAGTYLVTTLDEGTTTYSDDLSDATLQANVAYAESGYWSPPSGISIVAYHAASDRIFCAAANAVYWSEAGKYQTFVYDEATGLYENTNDVFLAGENVTAIIVLDEQIYVGSQKTWMRLRGRDPSSWVWEPTSAEKGPGYWRSCVVTRWGVIFVGNDGRLWLFNGFRSVPFLEDFVFDTLPGADCHATFDGRFYRLYYEDAAYPELVVDFYGYPNVTPRVVKSTRSAESSFYDTANGELYIGDSLGIVRNGDDTATAVPILIETPEVSVEDMASLGDMGKLVIRANTASADMTILQKEDGFDKTTLTPFRTSSLISEHKSISLNTYLTLAFVLSLTATGAVEIQDPLILAKDEG